MRNQVNSTGSQFFLMNQGESGQAPGQQIQYGFVDKTAAEAA